MNDVAIAEAPISPQTLEHVLGTGDISKLTVPQRVEFYRAACKSLGLNPLTRPIRFLSFQGQMQAYFTRDGCDQLRKNHKITLHVMDKRSDGDVYIVTVRARMPDGREDEDIGAVTLGRATGDSRANALMKCLTKAKRRVTLSICGLGWTAEDELDTMPGATTFDADAEAPPAPQPLSEREQFNRAVPMPSPERPAAAWQAWLDKLEGALADLKPDAIAEMQARPTVRDAREQGPQWVRDAIDRVFTHAYAAAAVANAEAEADEIPFPDLTIPGEDKLGAG
jgi:hypothetical protein